MGRVNHRKTMRTSPKILVLYAILASLMILWLGNTNNKLKAELETYRNKEFTGKIDPEKVHQFALPEAPVLGDENAAHELVYFTDYACPFCSDSWVDIKAVLEAYPIKVRVALLPRKGDPYQMGLSAGAIATEKHGFFYEVHDYIFSSSKRVDPETLAANFGLPEDFFTTGNINPETEAAFQQNIAAARSTGLRGVPTVFINGKWLGEVNKTNIIEAITEQE